MSNENDKDQELVELFTKVIERDIEKDNSIINLLIASTFSSDALMTVEDCDISIKRLNQYKQSFENANIKKETKQMYINIINNGIEVCKRDRETFQKLEEQNKKKSKTQLEYWF